MGTQENIRDIERSEVDEKVGMLKKLLGPSENLVFKLAEPISEYNEYDSLSSSDMPLPDRTVIRILFENGTSAVFYLNTETQQPSLIKAFKTTDEGIQIVTPVSKTPPLNKIEFRADTSKEAMQRYLGEVSIGRAIKPMRRYVPQAPQKVS